MVSLPFRNIFKILYFILVTYNRHVSQKWVGIKLETNFFPILYNNQKMKQNSTQPIFQEWNLPQDNIENLFQTKSKDQFFGQFKIFQENTSESSILASGEWRTNIMISGDTTQTKQRALTLKHTTSFEENSMENHGKRIKQSFYQYVSQNKGGSLSQTENLTSDQNFSTWDLIEQFLYQLRDLDEQTKNSLVNFGKRNIEAQILMKQIISLIPKKYVKECLKITEELFQVYKNENIQKMDEDQLQIYISLNYSKTSETIQSRIVKEEMIPSNPQNESLFEEMISLWMQSVFLALNGILQNPYDRKTPFHELQGFQTFQTGRKLIKID